MTLVPIGDKVILKQSQKQSVERGIILPDSAQKRPNEGKVLAVGDGLLLANGQRKALQVQDGDRVLFESYTAVAVKLDGEEYLIVPESGILAIID